MEYLRSATRNRLVIIVFFLLLLLILYFYYAKNSEKIPTNYQFVGSDNNNNNVNTKINVSPPKPRVDAVTGSLFKSNIKRKSHLDDNHIQELLKVKRKTTDQPCHVPMIGVVTTLKNGNQCLKEIANLIDLIVVGDAGSPEVFTFSNNSEPVAKSVEFLSLEKQNALYPEISRLLPTNHFARKNIGFIHAMNRGACLVYDFDDDNYLSFLTSNLLSGIANTTQIPSSSFFLTSKDKVVNPYPLYGAPNYIWPRGFPLELIHKREFPILKKDNFGVIDVVQIMQDIDPDVDANWRLEYSKHLPMNWIFWDSIRYELLKIDPNRWTPFNAQATLLSGRIAKFALLPHTVHGRVSDIWRSYIMQYMMKLFSNPGVVSFSGMVVEHKRNSHAYMADRDAEEQLIKQVNSLVDYLDEKVKKRLQEDLSIINLEEEYINLIDDLYMRGYLEKEDVELAVLWQLAITERPVAETQSTVPKPIPTILKDDPFLNVTVVLHINFGHLPAIPIWMAIYGHYFSHIRVYAPVAPGCMQISGITVYCIDRDVTGVLSYASTLHSIMSEFNIRYQHDWTPISTDVIVSMDPDAFKDEGLLFLHDDMFIKKSEIANLGGSESYLMTDQSIPIALAEQQNWGWLVSDIYGRPAMERFKKALYNDSVEFYKGQSDGYFLAKKDMLNFAKYGFVALESKLFLEITVPTIYNSFLNAHSTKWTFTTFDPTRFAYTYHVERACADENVKMLHPVKFSGGEGLHAHYLC